MKRQLLTFLLLFCTVLTALSQGDSSGQHTIGYCTDDLSGAEAIGLGDGQERVSAAIHLPRTLMMRYQGTRITRLRFAVRSGLQDASVWIRSSLTTSSRVVQSVSQLSDGWNEVVLNQPLTVDGEELYIGYTATQPAGYSGILAAGTGTEHTSWLAAANQWADYHADGLGVLFIEAVAEGSLLQRAATVISLQADRELYATDATMTVSGEVENLGTEAIDGCSLQFLVDGQLVTTHDITTTLQPYAVDSFRQAVSLTGLAEGAHSLEVRPAAAATTQEAMQLPFYILATPYPRTLLLEHFTSLPCINCPPVDEMLEEVVSQRSDVAWVSHHVGYKEDEFTLSGSLPLVRFGVNGNPYIMLDRTTLDDVQPAFTIGNYSADFVQGIFQYAASMPAIAQLSATATLQEGQLHIGISGEGKSFLADYMPRAALHVYLVEDSVEAEGTQAGNAGKRLHDNILRAIVTPARGALPQWQAGDGQLTFSTQYAIDPDAAWKPQYLRVVAFLTAPAPAGAPYPTGPVLNTVQSRLADASAITLAADGHASHDSWYHLDGRRVSRPAQDGLYIRNGKKFIYHKP